MGQRGQAVTHPVLAVGTVLGGQAAARVTRAAPFTWRCACVCARMCVSKSLWLSGF